MKIKRTFVDSGFSTAEVYRYCRRGRGRYAVKGKGGGGILLLYRSTQLRDEGIILTILGVDDGKSEIYARLKAEDGRLHFPFLCDLDFFKQLLSEERVTHWTRGLQTVVWEPVNRTVRNEVLDTFVYALTAAKSLAGKKAEVFWQRLLEPESKKPAVRTVRQRTMDIWN